METLITTEAYSFYSSSNCSCYHSECNNNLLYLLNYFYWPLEKHKFPAVNGNSLWQYSSTNLCSMLLEKKILHVGLLARLASNFWP